MVIYGIICKVAETHAGIRKHPLTGEFTIFRIGSSQVGFTLWLGYFDAESLPKVDGEIHSRGFA